MSPGPPPGGGAGVVAAFDEARGWGLVIADGLELPFHCTAIADGTRRIEVGATVAFETAAGLMGRWEATGLRELG